VSAPLFWEKLILSVASDDEDGQFADAFGENDQEDEVAKCEQLARMIELGWLSKFAEHRYEITEAGESRLAQIRAMSPVEYCRDLDEWRDRNST